MVIQKLSIGVPVYNGEKDFGETLNSLLNQAFEDFTMPLPIARKKYAATTLRKTSAFATIGMNLISALHRTIGGSSH
jgi:hypothetical protein